MKCTDCHTVVKPIAAIDIDGTLGDYHGHFARFAAAYLNTEVRQDQYDYTLEFNEFLDIPKPVYRDAKLAYRQGGWKRLMPVFSHAAALTFRLMNAGAEVWLVTNRPWQRFDNTDPDTRDWLSRHGILYDHLIYDDDKLARLVDLVDPKRVVAVLDDIPGNMVRAYDLGLPAIQMRRGHGWLTRFEPHVTTLEEAEKTIISRVDEWYAAAGDRDVLRS